MDKTIENKLFAEFQNGAAAMCLKYIKWVIVNKTEKLDEWENKYYSAFPTEVAMRTDSFDDIAWPINIVGEYRIAQEISDNLDICKDDGQRERYIVEILSVFEEWGAIFTPVARLKELEKMLKYGCTTNSEQEIEEEIERIKNLHDDYLGIMRGAKKGSMEYYLDVWHSAFFKFANMLAAICAEHHINLLELQEKRGIWIIEKLDVLDIQSYFGYNGNLFYANSLLKSLPITPIAEHLIFTERYGDGRVKSEAAWKGENASATTDLRGLLKELATEKALKYIPVAIERGLIEYTADGFLWKGKSNVLLELFFGIIYCGDEIKPSRRCNDEWHLGSGEFPSAALSVLFPAIKNIGQQRVNHLITPHKSTRYRTAPKNWKTITEVFD